MSGELLRCAVCRTEIPRGENGFVVCQGCNDTSDLYKLYAHHKARAEKAEKELNAALLYATDLATSYVKQMYPENVAWMPLQDICGVLSQIDNAFTAWFGDRVRADKAEAEVERLREALQFYAAKTHMMMEGIPAGTTLYVTWDNGRVARKALGGGE